MCKKKERKFKRNKASPLENNLKFSLLQHFHTQILTLSHCQEMVFILKGMGQLGFSDIEWVQEREVRDEIEGLEAVL